MKHWLKLLYQIIDFMFKAAVFFAASPDGQKEWSDIVTAYEVLVNNDQNDGTVSYSVKDVKAETEAPQPKVVNWSKE